MNDTIVDQELLQNYILCLAETQLLQLDDWPLKKCRFATLTPHSILNQNNFKSLIFCQTNSVSIIDHKKYDGMSLVKKQKDHQLSFSNIIYFRISNNHDFVL